MRLRSGSALFPLAVLAALAGFTFWMETVSREGTAVAGGKDRHDPDFWISDLTLHRYDVNGAIQKTLTAKRLEHYPDDESSRVFEPRLDMFADRRSTATATTAFVDKDIKHVRLEGDVRIVRPGLEGEADTVITTEVLDVRPDDEHAHTKSPVTITQGTTVIKGAGGIELNNKTRTAVMSGPVQGVIDRKLK
jgi:lipopolysaccharide export system protein LptC